MQIIHSNPWGFRIHSPYVYRMVTQGLSGKMILHREMIGPEWHLNFREKKKLIRILSLIEFFGAEKICITDETCFPGLHIKEVLQRGNFKDKKSDHRFPESFSRIMIGIDPSLPLAGIQDKEIRIMTDLRHQNNRKLFRELQSNPLVSISVESRNMGILIFHSSFQKQQYHIRSWFYLC